ncbi:MAG: hypothetical protein HQL40_14700, partial [Alphaproteobacteria bacterium]|nr:hypothetical protein [Alphaproteobacteria bacterium]
MLWTSTSFAVDRAGGRIRQERGGRPHPCRIARPLRRHGVETKALKGMGYDIAHDTWSATDDLSVNYMLCGV